ncbi:MAG: radical SAM protein [Clostridiales Family XIII bacterium]|nr:radical SAM protein [Clostridiales Family XIII bacterium]
MEASYVRDGGAVFVEKACAAHGCFRALASEDADAFFRWMEHDSVNVPPRVFVTEGACGAFASGTANTECPWHCGVCNNHLMTACCVLLNVTGRCNQRCPYCFANAGAGGGASGGAAGADSAGDPPLQDIERWLDRLIELGEERKFNIQLNGGEPTVRDDLPEIVRLCKAKGFEYVQLNTNGRRLAGESRGELRSPGRSRGELRSPASAGLAYAKELKAAGLSTVFLQFDGVSDGVYEALRGEKLFELKRRAIESCGAAGLPVTLVPTVTKHVNLAEVGQIIGFMLEHVRTVKGVHFQPASFFGRQPSEPGVGGDFPERVTMFALMEEIERQTGGRIPARALAPISTGHPLCCFCATFLKEPGGGVTPLAKPEGPEGRSCCCGPEDPLEIVRRDRDFVLNKWDSGGGADGELPGADGAQGADISEPMSFDDALVYIRSNLFTISGMSFMDATNLDAERLRRCRVQVFTGDGRLVPFCGYYTLEGSGFPCP